MKTIFALTVLLFCISSNADLIFTAALKDGVVQDVEQFEETNIPPARKDGLARTIAPFWIVTGSKFNGVEWTYADGSVPKQEVIDAKVDQDLAVQVKTMLGDIQTGKGEVEERMKRLEDAVYWLLRMVSKLLGL